MRGLALLPLLAAMVVGCGSPDEDLAPAFVPKVHAFEGEVDPKLAGTWVSTDGVSTLDLAKDGSLKIQTLTPSPNGPTKSNVEGKWLASDGSLLLKYGSPGKADVVLKYASVLSADELKLTPDGSRRETVYKRK